MSADVAHALASTRRHDRQPSGGSLPNPLDPSLHIRAVLFDLDGTLYRAAPLRALMALELFALPLLFNPGRAPRHWRALGAYRRAQEQLRTHGSRDGETLGRAQLITAGRRANMPVTELESLVNEWMFTRPLKYLRMLRASGLAPLLDWLAARDVRTGVLSDYPAAAKLTALELANQFSLVLSSTDPDIGALKPHPRGFLRACERWRLHPARGARGRRSSGRRRGRRGGSGHAVRDHRRAREPRPVRLILPLTSFERLHRVLERRR